MDLYLQTAIDLLWALVKLAAKNLWTRLVDFVIANWCKHMGWKHCLVLVFPLHFGQFLHSRWMVSEPEQEVPSVHWTHHRYYCSNFRTISMQTELTLSPKATKNGKFFTILQNNENKAKILLRVEQIERYIE